MGGIYIKNKWLPYLLILPTIVLICVFKIYPIIDSVIQEFFPRRAVLHWIITNYCSLIKHFGVLCGSL